MPLQKRTRNEIRKITVWESVTTNAFSESRTWRMGIRSTERCRYRRGVRASNAYGLQYSKRSLSFVDSIRGPNQIIHRAGCKTAMMLQETCRNLSTASQHFHYLWRVTRFPKRGVSHFPLLLL
jgi:hypothetical protein